MEPIDFKTVALPISLALFLEKYLYARRQAGTTKNMMSGQVRSALAWRDDNGDETEHEKIHIPVRHRHGHGDLTESGDELTSPIVAEEQVPVVMVRAEVRLGLNDRRIRDKTSSSIFFTAHAPTHQPAYRALSEYSKT